MSSAFLPSGHSRDKIEFPPQPSSRECHDSPAIRVADRSGVEAPNVPDVFLPAGQLGKCCDPPLGAEAVVFDAALHDWRSRTRTLPGGKMKREYSLSDALNSLGPRLAGPIALAVIHEWQHVGYMRFSMSREERSSVVESQRELIQKRLTVLHVWRESLQYRPKGCNVEQATLDFALAWNADHPELHVSKTGLYRWWDRYQLFGVAGLARLVGSQKGPFKKIIPAPFWRALCRQYCLRWLIPSMETVVSAALNECSDAIRAECERLVESGTVQRRLSTIPDAVLDLLPFARPAPTYSRTAASLARSRRVLRLLLWLHESEPMASVGGQP